MGFAHIHHLIRPVDREVEMAKTILVTGATGKQGSGVVRALSAISKNDGSFKILALTRNPSSDAAKALTTLPGVQVIQGDLDDPEPIFSAHKLDGVFSVQDYAAKDEAKQGIAIVDLSVKYKIGQLVYTGVDFAGQENTPLHHFETKRKIEARIHSVPPDALSWTIIRPVGFYENFYWDEWPKAVSTRFSPTANYKLIGCDDIGRVAAHVFSRPEAFNHKAIDLAADSLKQADIAKIWLDVTGKPLPNEKPNLPEAFDKNVEFNATHEFVADVQENRRLFPFLTDFATWLRSTPLAKDSQ
ncbi:hypothetical protein BCR39DRAFT_529465 [Naematelia encephala]|uniref:NmrA-like domain-containing protein n=1 Tax=Naematelia encephala TaxID=71784 RepID=A0A1Y2B8D8_9TREE|nr:hypothetical protein BCR39DRAFT_529465 [Naematelia encephala]